MHMPPFMRDYKKQFKNLLYWILPSGTELVMFTGLSFITLTLSNAPFLKSVLYLPKDFQLTTATLNSINNLLVKVFGEDASRFGVVSFFWALVGAGVYVLIWLAINFSEELGNDLAVTKYIHPKNIDTHSPLLNMLSRISFQFVALCLFFLYVNILIGALLPYVGEAFRTSITRWPNIASLYYGFLGIILEILALHTAVVLLRSLTLRKRIFG